MTKPFGIFAFSVASLCAAGLLGAASADAKTFHYNFSLTGGQETPSNTSKGSGLAKVTYDDKSHELGWTVSYKGLTGDATMAHFHGPAKKGAAADITVWAMPMGAAIISPIIGSATLTDAQAKQLEAGLWYFNIHTAAHPKGEIRGQVVAGHAVKPKPAPAPEPAPAAAAAPMPMPAPAAAPAPMAAPVAAPPAAPVAAPPPAAPAPAMPPAQPKD